MHFPFLIGEAKTERVGLGVADVQNVHSAALAMRAIIKLYEAAFGANHREVNELMGKNLVFTISHDSQRATIWGHFVTRNPPISNAKRMKLSIVNERPDNRTNPDVEAAQSAPTGPNYPDERPTDPNDIEALQNEDPEPIDIDEQPADPKDMEGAHNNIQGPVSSKMIPYHYYR